MWKQLKKSQTSINKLGKEPIFKRIEKEAVFKWQLGVRLGTSHNAN